MNPRALLRAVSAVALAAAGCYEIPPELPEGYRQSAAPSGWPPPTVYSDDALHPANRWFHRAYAPRGPRGVPEAVSGDLPFSAAGHPRPADRAELRSLLESLRDGGAAELAGGPGRWILAADLAGEAVRFTTLGDEILAEEHLRTARIAASGAVRPPLPVPPPLELEGGGGDGAGRKAAAAPHRAEAGGTGRWYQKLEGALVEADERTAGAALVWYLPCGEVPGDLARLRHPVAYWFFLRDGGRVTPRVFRLDRGALRRGEKPWRDLPPDADIVVRDPDSHELRRGILGDLCLSCHCSERTPD